MRRLAYCVAALVVLTFHSANASTPKESKDPDIDDGDKPIAKADVVAVRSFTAPRVGQFHVVVRKDGHQQKMPYLFELRPTCGGPRRKWDQLNSGTVVSSCEADPKSIKYDAKKGIVTMLVKNVDWEGYDQTVRQVGPAKAGEPKCKTKSELATLSLADLCPK